MFVIRATNGLSHTGYNYWNQEKEIALLDLDNATQFETEEEAKACADDITDVESKMGIPWFEITTLESATIQWEESLGRAGSNHNPHRHTDATKILVSPNQVMIALECRGVLFDCPNFKHEDPDYLTILEEAHKDVARRKDLTRMLTALKAHAGLLVPEKISESDKKNYLIEDLAWVYYVVRNYAADDAGADILNCYNDAKAVDADDKLNIINFKLNELCELATNVVRFENPLTMNMQGMDWYKSMVDKIFELWDTNNKVFPFEMESPISFTLIGTEHERSFAMEILRQYAFTENVFQAVNVTDIIKLKDVLISASAITFTNAPLALIQLSGFMPWNSPAATPLRQQMALKEKAAEHGFDVSDFTQGQFDSNVKR